MEKLTFLLLKLKLTFLLNKIKVPYFSSSRLFLLSSSFKLIAIAASFPSVIKLMSAACTREEFFFYFPRPFLGIWVPTALLS